MTDKEKPKLDKLELNKETVKDLTEDEAGSVEGGAVAVRQSKLVICTGTCDGRASCGVTCPPACKVKKQL